MFKIHRAALALFAVAAAVGSTSAKKTDKNLRPVEKDGNDLESAKRDLQKVVVGERPTGNLKNNEKLKELQHILECIKNFERIKGIKSIKETEGVIKDNCHATCQSLKSGGGGLTKEATRIFEKISPAVCHQECKKKQIVGTNENIKQKCFESLGEPTCDVIDALLVDHTCGCLDNCKGEKDGNTCSAFNPTTDFAIDTTDVGGGNNCGRGSTQVCCCEPIGSDACDDLS